MYTREEATIIVEDHIRWLEGPGERKTVADALRWLFYYMGGAKEPAESTGPQKVMYCIVAFGGCTSWWTDLNDLLDLKPSRASARIVRRNLDGSIEDIYKWDGRSQKWMLEPGVQL